MRTIRVALCLPWYNGADPDCVASFLTFQHYLGRVQERAANPISGRPLRPLDSWDQSGDAEIPPQFQGVNFEFIVCALIGYSLPGTARERCIDQALASGADYLLWYDDDMMFDAAVFFRLLRHELPIVAALAFTARDPITPVIYKFEDMESGGVRIEPVWDYKRNALQKVDAIGFGVVLMQATVFRKIPKPWFSRPGAGEDIQFCMACKQHNIPVYVDTSAATVHKPRYSPEWHDEGMYLLSRDPDYIAHKKNFEEYKVARLREIVGGGQ